MKRFGITTNGYDIEEVNRFVDVVIKKLEQLNNENIKYKEQLENYESKSFNNPQVDNNVSKALIAAEEAADKMKKLARSESEMIIEDAKRNANAIIHEALVSAEKTQSEADMLKKNITVYKNRVKSLLQAQLEIADDLDSIKL